MLKKQIAEIQPSVKDALFRLLRTNVHYKYLQKGKSVIGFELDLENNEPLDGYVFIALNKHGIMSYKNDFGEDMKLILFPTQKIMLDEDFNIAHLNVLKKSYPNDSFNGKLLKKGKLGELMKEYLPPVTNIELPDFNSVSEKNVIFEVNRDVFAPNNNAEKITVNEERVKTDKSNIKNEYSALPLNTQLITLFDEGKITTPNEVFDHCINYNSTFGPKLETLFNYCVSHPRYVSGNTETKTFMFIELINKAYREGKL